MTITDRPIPPMPDLDCPSWCDRDHEADWRMHVDVGRDTRGIPMADGTVLHNHTPEAEWLAMFEPLHLRNVATIAFTAPNEHATIDLQRGVQADTGLYIDAHGDITAEQARAFAAGLLKAADALDRITQPASPVALEEAPTCPTRPSESEIVDMFVGWGRRVCEARIKAGLTQAQLAGLTQVAPGTISRIEAGDDRMEPSIHLRMALAGALDVRVEDLFPFPVPGSVVRDDRGQAAALDGYSPLNP